MNLLGSCSLCGEEIHEHEQHAMYQQVVGWERVKRRKQGGTNALRLESKTGAFAHGHCMEQAVAKRKRGIAIHQKGLF